MGDESTELPTTNAEQSTFRKPNRPVPDWPHASTDDPIFSNTLGLRGPLLSSYVRHPSERQHRPPAPPDGEATEE